MFLGIRGLPDELPTNSAHDRRIATRRRGVAIGRGMRRGWGRPVSVWAFWGLLWLAVAATALGLYLTGSWY
jgi:hypothetical protein